MRISLGGCDDPPLGCCGRRRRSPGPAAHPRERTGPGAWLSGRLVDPVSRPRSGGAVRSDMFAVPFEDIEFRAGASSVLPGSSASLAPCSRLSPTGPARSSSARECRFLEASDPGGCVCHVGTDAVQPYNRRAGSGAETGHEPGCRSSCFPRVWEHPVPVDRAVLFCCGAHDPGGASRRSHLDGRATAHLRELGAVIVRRQPRRLADRRVRKIGQPISVRHLRLVGRVVTADDVVLADRPVDASA